MYNVQCIIILGCKTIIENQTNEKEASFPYLILIIVILMIIIVVTIGTTIGCYVTKKRKKKKRTGSAISTDEKFYLKPLKDREGKNLNY